jgi:hypothetical protein
MSSGNDWRTSIRCGILLGVLSCPIGALAQAYGDQDQILTVAAGAFRDGSQYPTLSETDGYLYNGSSIFRSFRAILPLPEGAEVRQICMYVYDGTAAQATVSLVAVKLVPGGGGDPAIVTIPNAVVSSMNDIGYGYYCTGTFSYTVRDVFDVDGDGTPDAVAYYLQADLPEFSSSIELGGVRVTWRRQVSLPPAIPTFGDVPSGDGGFGFIEAMAASGITGGCGGGNYCPDAHVTRRQMAIFLAKALGLHWGG